MSKVSVIIPVYNVEQYLRQCLDSVVNQTLEDIEIICVNDCSPDNSGEILSEYAQNDSRIKIITLEQNGGLGNTRNVALKEVNSEYIMFLDSDDWLELNACELAYNQISKNKNDFVLFGLYTYEENKEKRYINKDKLTQFLNIEGQTNAKPSDINIPFFSNGECWYKIYDKNFLLNNNILFDKGGFEDQRFNVKILTLASSISILNEPLYNYRRREQSITAISKYWKDFIQAKKRAYQLIKEINISNNKFIDYFLIATINSIFFYFKKYTKIDKSITEDFYNELQKFFQQISKENNLEEVEDFVDYKLLKIVNTSKTYKQFLLKKLLFVDFFSIRKTPNKIIINILGIKFSLKIKKEK
ncbi:MAG: glycosyltransferase [Candidatus Gastranaerophilales bacterium]|nr:glycosyltransferase [Candidatus Gastranaerophilales bacterium]